MIYGQVPLITGVFRGLALAGAAGVAHVGIAVADWWFSGGGSLPAALVGTLCFAIAYLFFDGMHSPAPPTARCGILHVIEFGVGAAAYWVTYSLVTPAVGDVNHFYCQSTVPWGIGIAVFGAFMSELLLDTVHRSRYKGVLEPAVFLSLFWISPFYGFFRAPIFLAQGLLLGCENREARVLIIAAIAMWLSACAGKSVAGWLHSESGRKE